MEASSPTEDDGVGSAASSNNARLSTIVDDPSPGLVGYATSDGLEPTSDADAGADAGDDTGWDAPIWIDRVWDRFALLGWRRIITFLP